MIINTAKFAGQVHWKLYVSRLPAPSVWGNTMDIDANFHPAIGEQKWGFKPSKIDGQILPAKFGGDNSLKNR